VLFDILSFWRYYFFHRCRHLHPAGVRLRKSTCARGRGDRFMSSRFCRRGRRWASFSAHGTAGGAMFRRGVIVVGSTPGISPACPLESGRAAKDSDRPPPVPSRHHRRLASLSDSGIRSIGWFRSQSLAKNFASYMRLSLRMPVSYRPILSSNLLLMKFHYFLAETVRHS